VKILVAFLLVLLLLLQYRLWFGAGSIQEVSRLRNAAAEGHAELIRLNNRNKALAAEVADLKSGLDAIEERARADLGMISEGETFYQFVLEAGAKYTDNEDASTDTGAQMGTQTGTQTGTPLSKQ